MRHFAFFFLALIAFDFSCSTKSSGSSETTAAKLSYTNSQFRNEDGTFGFDILKEGRIFIHQPIMPAVPGNIGFDTEADAQKVAHLMIRKLTAGIQPPTISLMELDSLGLLPK